jgi:hypothetical protein
MRQKYVQVLINDDKLQSLIDGYEHVTDLDQLSKYTDNSLDKIVLHNYLNSISKEDLKNIFSLICSKLRKGGFIVFNIFTLDSFLLIDRKNIDPNLLEEEIDSVVDGGLKCLPRYKEIIGNIERNNMLIDSVIKEGYIKNVFTITR